MELGSTRYIGNISNGLPAINLDGLFQCICLGLPALGIPVVTSPSEYAFASAEVIRWERPFLKCHQTNDGLKMESGYVPNVVPKFPFLEHTV